METLQVDPMNKLAKELIPDGNAADQPDSDFDPKQLAMGVKVEMEHTKNKALAKEIAKDHLAEIPDYYTKLIKMEKEATALPEIVQEIRGSLRRDPFAYGEFPSVFGSNSYAFNIDRFRRHDHGGYDSGDDGDDGDGDGWLPDYEIEDDFYEGERKHKHQLDLVNKMLEEAGYEPNAQFDLDEKGHFDVVFQLKEKKSKKVKKVKKMLKGGAYPMAPEPEKINLKERWDNEEWNKLDGAPEEEVLTQPLRSRRDYGESMKVSKELRKIASSLKTSSYDDESPEALHWKLNHDDDEEDFWYSANKCLGSDWKAIRHYSGRGMMGRKALCALSTDISPHSSKGEKFLKESGAHVESLGKGFVYYLK